MRLNEIDYDGLPPIDGYGPGFFRVAGKVHEGSLLLLPSGQKNWGGFDDLDPILAETKGIDVLFLGVGADLMMLPEAMRDALKRADLAYEIMATPTACRSYNVLLSEGRRVAAALIAV